MRAIDASDTRSAEFAYYGFERGRRLDRIVHMMMHYQHLSPLHTERFVRTLTVLVHEATLPMLREETAEVIQLLRQKVHPHALQRVLWCIQMARNDQTRLLSADARLATDEEVDAWIESLPDSPTRSEKKDGPACARPHEDVAHRGV